MSLGLHKQCLDRLSEVIRLGLERVRVNNRMFVHRPSMLTLLDAEDVIPQTGKIRTSIEEYITETPAFDFVYEVLSRELHEKQTFDSDVPMLPLGELAGYEDLGAVSARLVSEFNSLPWDYTLTIPLTSTIGEYFAKTLKSYEICESVRLVTPDDGFEQKYNLTSGIEARDQSLSGGALASLLLRPRPPTWDRDTNHLQILVIGFIGRYESTVPLELAIGRTKAFFGLSIALRLFKLDRKYRATPPKAKFYIHRKIGDKWVVEGTRELESAQSEVFHDLVLHDLEGKLGTDQVREGWARRTLTKIGTVFRNEPRARRVLLASQWLFDSHCGSDELLSFVQSAVVLEILLGDKAVSDLMGLGELLRNRCAYLISSTTQERERILRDFKAIYEVRSSIVHAGKTRLNMNERHLFSRLQWMCRRVIQKEVELLEKEVNGDA